MGARGHSEGLRCRRAVPHGVWHRQAAPHWLRPERVLLSVTLFQASNNVWASFGYIDLAFFIKVDIYRAPLFGCYVNASDKTLVVPPKKHHEEIIAGKDVAVLNS